MQKVQVQGGIIQEGRKQRAYLSGNGESSNGKNRLSAKNKVRHESSKETFSVRNRSIAESGRFSKEQSSHQGIQRIRKRNVKENKATYRCTNGERVTQAEIEARYYETCQRIDQEREPFCEATGRTDLPLSHSHTISRKRCKDIGKADLIWDADNIFLESMGASDSGHYTWENKSLDHKKKLLNFDRKLEYIKKHDHELYQKFV